MKREKFLTQRVALLGLVDLGFQSSHITDDLGDLVESARCTHACVPIQVHAAKGVIRKWQYLSENGGTISDF